MACRICSIIFYAFRTDTILRLFGFSILLKITEKCLQFTFSKNEWINQVVAQFLIISEFSHHFHKDSEFFFFTHHKYCKSFFVFVWRFFRFLTLQMKNDLLFFWCWNGEITIYRIYLVVFWTLNVCFFCH